MFGSACIGSAGLVAGAVAGEVAGAAGETPGAVIGETPGTAGEMPGAVAGDMPVAGGIPVAGAPGAAGVVMVVGAPGAAVTAGVIGAPAGAVAAGLVAVPGGAVGAVWPNEVNASVTEQRLAVSSVFIGLIGKFFPGRFRYELFILNQISASRAKLSRLSFRHSWILAEPHV